MTSKRSFLLLAAIGASFAGLSSAQTLPGGFLLRVETACGPLLKGPRNQPMSQIGALGFRLKTTGGNGPTTRHWTNAQFWKGFAEALSQQFPTLEVYTDPSRSLFVLVSTGDHEELMRHHTARIIAYHPQAQIRLEWTNEDLTETAAEASNPSEPMSSGVESGRRSRSRDLWDVPQDSDPIGGRGDRWNADLSDERYAPRGSYRGNRAP